MHLSWKRIVIYIMPLLIMAFIFVQSALPADLSSEESGFFVERICRILKADPEIITVVVRKAAHFCEYLVLGISLIPAVHKGVTEKEREGRKQNADRRSPRVSESVTACIIGALFSVSDEIHQHFVLGRSCELRDILIDSAGILCGVVLTALFRRSFYSRSHRPQATDRPR